MTNLRERLTFTQAVRRSLGVELPIGAHPLELELQMADVDPDSLHGVIADLVTANRILLKHSIVDAFGHVSARHPERSEHFLLSRNLAPAMVQPDDILEFDPSGAPVDPEHPPIYLERFIHAAIYRARPDVGAVIHSHSRSVIPFATVKGCCLRPLSHMAGFLGAGTPHFEIRDTAGPASDLLVRSNTLGDDLAQAMGDANVVLMRGHGVTVVGRDLRQAVFHAVYTEWNANIQMQALQLGEPVFMNPEEAAAAAATNDGQSNRAWAYWSTLTRSDAALSPGPE